MWQCSVGSEEKLRCSGINSVSIQCSDAQSTELMLNWCSAQDYSLELHFKFIGIVLAMRQLKKSIKQTKKLQSSFTFPVSQWEAADLALALPGCSAAEPPLDCAPGTLYLIHTDTLMVSKKYMTQLCTWSGRETPPLPLHTYLSNLTQCQSYDSALTHV